MRLDMNQLGWLFGDPILNPYYQIKDNVKVTTDGLEVEIVTRHNDGLFIPVEDVALMATYYNIFHRDPTLILYLKRVRLLKRARLYKIKNQYHVSTP
jgi:hypothetical protein